MGDARRLPGLAGDLVAVSDLLLDAGDRNGWAVRGLALAALAARAADDGGGGDAESRPDPSPADPDADAGAEPGHEDVVPGAGGGGLHVAAGPEPDGDAVGGLLNAGAVGRVSVVRKGGVDVARPVPSETGPGSFLRARAAGHRDLFGHAYAGGVGEGCAVCAAAEPAGDHETRFGHPHTVQQGLTDGSCVVCDAEIAAWLLDEDDDEPFVYDADRGH